MINSQMLKLLSHITRFDRGVYFSRVLGGNGWSIKPSIETELEYKFLEDDLDELEKQKLIRKKGDLCFITRKGQEIMEADHSFQRYDIDKEMLSK